VLVEVVRFTQKNGLRGCDGGWKDFLARNDRKFGASVSDPRKRTRDVLLAFLQTFSKDFQKVGYSFVSSSDFSSACLDSLAAAVVYKRLGPWCVESLNLATFWLQYFGKLVKRHKERSAVQQYMTDFPDEVSPEQVMCMLDHAFFEFLRYIE
jgi:RNA exonuclease 1